MYKSTKLKATSKPTAKKSTKQGKKKMTKGLGPKDSSNYC